ncbi:MAG: GNAT family N-acetyltransferase [Pseudomonadota bacterium]
MQITFESPNQIEIIKLIDELDAYQNSLYPPESLHFLDIESLMQSNVIFVVARDHAHRALGCGAVVKQSEFGEIKRMYVHPSGRGQGIARAMLVALETRAEAEGCKLLKLETGARQPEAIRLYVRSGFEPCGAFGDSGDDPLSVFMQKKIVDSF